MKKHNFSAGPSILSNEVFSKASESVLNLNNIGLSLIEISHRSKDFVAVMEEARELSIDLLGLKAEDYTSLFLQGGASTQFLMIAYNFLSNDAGYINTGSWSGLKKEDLKNLAKPIKSKLGIGGSIKNNEIYFQGDKRDKIISILESEGHSVKRIGG